MTHEKENFAALKAAFKAIDDKFGFDVVMLDIREVSVLSDYFIIASANNPPQLKAIADAVQEEMRKIGQKLTHSEGVTSARWVLLDFSGITVHLFCQEDREYYKLELLWGDAKVVLPESLE